jgi:hypothetical protein
MSSFEAKQVVAGEAGAKATTREGRKAYYDDHLLIRRS